MNNVVFSNQAEFYKFLLHSSSLFFILRYVFFSSDLITALGTITFDVDFMVRGYFSHGMFLCGLMHTTFLISLPSSMLAVSLLTLERFVSVVHPLRVGKIVTKSKVLGLLVVEWLYVVILSLFPIIYNSDGDAVHIVCGICHLKFPIEYQLFQVRLQ